MKFKRLLTQGEEATYDRLQQACERHGAHAHPKVRLADVLPIDNSGISNDLFSFALKAHFDFVVAENHQ